MVVRGAWCAGERVWDDVLNAWEMGDCKVKAADNVQPILYDNVRVPLRVDEHEGAVV